MRVPFVKEFLKSSVALEGQVLKYRYKVTRETIIDRFLNFIDALNEVLQFRVIQLRPVNSKIHELLSVSEQDIWLNAQEIS